MALRVDARASDDRTGIGGWCPGVGTDGNINVWSSPWYSLEMKQHVWPWVFEKGYRSELIISTLEALALLVALKASCRDVPSEHGLRVHVVPTWTDSGGNEAREPA